jgi:transposase
MEQKKGTTYKEWYSKENLILLEGWCRDGASDRDVCELIGISYSTLYKWISRYPEFAEAMVKGKEVVDRMVENALLKRCLGYDYVETERIRKDGIVISEKKVKKYMPPDVTACAIWLNNRKPDEWKRNRDNYTISENEGSVQINIIKKRSPDEEIEVKNVSGKTTKKK